MHLCNSRTRAALPALALLGGALACAPASAFDLLGIYVGGSAGQGKIETGSLASPVPTTVPTIGEFKADHSAYKLVAGIRPLPVIAVEAAYIDFGRTSQNFGSASNSAGIIGASTASGEARISGSAAFAILYLPIPVVDVFAKAGVSRLKTDATATVQLSGPILCPVTAPNCRFTQSSSSTDNGFAAGAGAGLKFGAFAIRAEYERFSTRGAYPALTTLGFTYAFL
jgi:hypothetical protein